jgi:DNA repair protein RadA/Sms
LGPAGALRAVPLCDHRLAEAARLGFSRALLPAQNAAQLSGASGLEVVPVDRLVTALAQM